MNAIKARTVGRTDGRTDGRGRAAQFQTGAQSPNGTMAMSRRRLTHSLPARPQKQAGQSSG